MVGHRLHEAYAPLAAAGMRFVASYQDVETTKGVWRWEKDLWAPMRSHCGTITLAKAVATHGSPFYDGPDVADFGQFAERPAYQRRGIGSRLIEMVGW
jgi:GNAT superfamily N-acetyltransferase